MKCEGENWTMHLGDCADVLATLEPVDHVISDPPYSATVHGSVRSSRRNAMPDKEEFGCRVRRSVDLGFEHLAPKLRRTCAREWARLVKRWVLVFSDAESSWLWRLSLRAAGLDYVKTAEWRRLNGAPQFTGDRPAQGFEPITLAHQPGRKRWNGGGKQGTYDHAIVLNRGGKNPREHTTQKPEPLMVDLVRDFTDPGEIVLDAFAGSGTTGVAALRLGRRFVGIERDEHYFHVACERLKAESQGSTLQAQRAGQASLFGIERP